MRVCDGDAYSLHIVSSLIHVYLNRPIIELFQRYNDIFRYHEWKRKFVLQSIAKQPNMGINYMSFDYAHE